MEEAVSEQLKQVEIKKEELKQSLDALSAQSSSLLEVSVKMKVLDAYFDSIFKMIENRVVEVRVRENDVEKMVDEIRVRENEVEKKVDEIRVRENEIEKMVDEIRVRETELEKRVDEVRVLRSEMCRKERWLEERGNRVLKKEDEMDERRKGLRLKQVRVGVLRTVIFDEICKEKMKLNDFEMRIVAREMKAEEMERANEEQAMRTEDERSRLAKRFDDRRKEMEWRGKRLENRKKLIDAKVKEMEAKELSLNIENKTFSNRVAEIDMKEKEARDAKRVVNCLVQELESERDENKALREEVSLLTQKLKSTDEEVLVSSANVRTLDDGNSELASIKASNIDYVTNLLSSNQRLEALKYICEFDLEDDFSIGTIVDIYVNNLKQNSRKLLEEKGNTAAAAQEAAELEISSLKELINCIKKHKLEDRYSAASLDERITKLERQFYLKKRVAPSADSDSHPSAEKHTQIHRSGKLQKTN